LWSPFAVDTAYFGAGSQSYMINLRVDDLDALLSQLRAAGVNVDERVDKSEYGAFGWITDPDGNRVELWQPPAA
jgi:predicted enzyme related to lactoylglutathione lyase